MAEKEPGYVYILTNPSFREDWVKIGKSSRPVDVRSKELDNTADMDVTIKRFEKRLDICRFTVEWLFKQISPTNGEENKNKGIQFSVIELLNDLKSNGIGLFGNLQDVQLWH